MKTTLYFVRHAHSSYTPEERVRPLSPKGLDDATKVSNLLKDESIDVIISSPYRRAIQTVQELANQLKLEILIEENLKERPLSASSVDNFNEAISKVWNDWTFYFPGGESNYAAFKRGIAAMNEILSTYKGQSILISTHGNLMVLMMNYFDSSYSFEFWKQLDMPDIYMLTFEETTLIDVLQRWNKHI
ncbi:MAG: histidine phosphatase family protein [Turicibacter sp.]